MSENHKIGILLLNLGGPDSIQAVRPFLFNLFSDRKIIRLGPAFLQKPIAWIISTLRSKKTEGMYRLIGDKSPIREITSAQAQALEASLNQESDGAPPESSCIDLGEEPHREFVESQIPYPKSMQFKVSIGMRYWHPFIKDAVENMRNNGIRRIIGLGLYPQYSIATSGSTCEEFQEAARSLSIEAHCISSWFNQGKYIDALADIIRRGLAAFNPDSEGSQSNHIHVLFSAHSLPIKFIDEGDPYTRQTLGTIEEIIRRIDIKWSLGYQSKSGPVTWIGPATDDMIRELAGKGIKEILIVPVSFVSDHIETLYEIDILYKGIAEKLGVRLKRTVSLNTHPLFIRAMKEIVMKTAMEKGWLK